jgi:hypothetical protein
MLATSKDGLPQFGNTLLASIWPALKARPVSGRRGVAAPEIATPPKAEKRGTEKQTVAAASIAPAPVQLMADPVGEDSPPSVAVRLASVGSQTLSGAAVPDAVQDSGSSPRSGTQALGNYANPAASDRALLVSGREISASGEPPAQLLRFPQRSEPSAKALTADSGDAPSASRLSKSTRDQDLQAVDGSNAILLAASAISPTISGSPLQGSASPPVAAPDRAGGAPIAAGGCRAPAISAVSLHGAFSPVVAAGTPSSAVSLDPAVTVAFEPLAGIPLPGIQLSGMKDAEELDLDKGHGSMASGGVASTAVTEKTGRPENGPASQPMAEATSGESAVDAKNTPLPAVGPQATSAPARGAGGSGRSVAALPGSTGATAPSATMPGAAIGPVSVMPHPGGATRVEVTPGNSVESRGGSATASELLARMDSGGTVSTPRLSPRSVEVGIDDPAHGWIEVRAQGVAGQVTASLNADSPEARAALHGQLPGMSQYLAEHDLGVRDLGVSAGVSGGFASPGHSGDTSFGGGSGGFGGGAGSSPSSSSGSSHDSGGDSGRSRGPGLARPQVQAGSGQTQRGAPGSALPLGGHLISIRV